MRNWAESRQQEDQRTKAPLSHEELPAPNPKKGRKNTRDWCKGKVGRQHTIEIMVPPNESWWKRFKNKPCRWSQWWRHPNTPTALGEVFWICRHMEICTTCGKHIKPIPRMACPDLDETTRPAPTVHPRYQ